MLVALLLTAFAMDEPEEPTRPQSALTFSYRAMVGASVRYEAAVASQIAVFVEAGWSGWAIYGDSPDGEASPLMSRPHLRGGFDYGRPVAKGGAMYLGPRLGVAHEAFSNGRSVPEAMLGGMFGKKWGQRGRFMLGVGGSYHVFLEDGQVAGIGLPGLELRVGPAW